jgi:hypothetical protein
VADPAAGVDVPEGHAVGEEMARQASAVRSVRLVLRRR